jgi:hypothetical protein
MNVDDMILVSIDDHVIEPPDMSEQHVPAKWRDEWRRRNESAGMGIVRARAPRPRRLCVVQRRHATTSDAQA